MTMVMYGVWFGNTSASACKQSGWVLPHIHHTHLVSSLHCQLSLTLVHFHSTHFPLLKPPPTLAALLSLNPIHLHFHLPALMYSVDSPLPGCLLHRFSFSTDCMTTICFPGLGMPSVPSLESSLRLCCRFKSQSIQELELMSSLSEG